MLRRTAVGFGNHYKHRLITTDFVEVPHLRASSRALRKIGPSAVPHASQEISYFRHERLKAVEWKSTVIANLSHPGSTMTLRSSFRRSCTSREPEIPRPISSARNCF